jgi:hypothetical protein
MFHAAMLMPGHSIFFHFDGVPRLYSIPGGHMMFMLGFCNKHEKAKQYRQPVHFIHLASFTFQKSQRFFSTINVPASA